MKKLWSYILIGLKAIGKFIHWPYVSHVTILFLSAVVYLSFSKVLGIVFVAWGIVLIINALIQGYESSYYTLSTENYSKKTPVNLKKIADILLSSILIIDPVMISIPDFAGKEWLIWGWNMAVVLFKLISKFVADENV
jgi:hypothetical protein